MAEIVAYNSRQDTDTVVDDDYKTRLSRAVDKVKELAQSEWGKDISLEKIGNWTTGKVLRYDLQGLSKQQLSQMGNGKYLKGSEGLQAGTLQTFGICLGLKSADSDEIDPELSGALFYDYLIGVRDIDGKLISKLPELNGKFPAVSPSGTPLTPEAITSMLMMSPQWQALVERVEDLEDQNGRLQSIVADQMTAEMPKVLKQCGELLGTVVSASISPEFLMNSIQAILDHVLTTKNTSIADLSKRIGISAETLKQLLKGELAPDESTIKLVCDGLNQTDWLPFRLTPEVLKLAGKGERQDEES